MHRPNTKKHIPFIAVIVLLIFLHFTGIIKPAEDLIMKALNPVFLSLHKASSYLRITYNERSDKENLINKINILEARVTNLIVENARFKSLDEENQVLREYLKFSKDNELSFVMGNIIARKGLDSNNLDQNIIVNKGAQDGVKIGTGVTSGGAVVGKVISVKSNASEVCLITNRDCKLAATIQNKDNTSGIINGELGLTIKMEFIPQTEELKIGDTVVTSGLEENIPRGLVLGTIEEISKESNELWQSATIEPLVDIDELVIVSILLP